MALLAELGRTGIRFSHDFPELHQQLYPADRPRSLCGEAGNPDSGGGRRLPGGLPHALAAIEWFRQWRHCRRLLQHLSVEHGRIARIIGRHARHSERQCQLVHHHLQLHRHWFVQFSGHPVLLHGDGGCGRRAKRRQRTGFHHHHPERPGLSEPRGGSQRRRHHYHHLAARSICDQLHGLSIERRRQLHTTGRGHEPFRNHDRVYRRDRRRHQFLLLSGFGQQWRWLQREFGVGLRGQRRWFRRNLLPQSPRRRHQRGHRFS